jgi:hypothetical protein
LHQAGLSALIGELDYALSTENQFIRDRAISLALHAAEKAMLLSKNLKLFTDPNSTEKQVIDLTQFTVDTIDLVEKEYEAKNITFDVQVEEGCMAEINANAIQHAFLNILNFSSHSLQQGGKILVKLKKEKRKHRITIHFFDKAISQPIFENLFNPDFKIPNDKGLNLGLGLFIARGILENMGSSLNVTTDIGKGTTFEISLEQGAEPPKNYSFKRKFRRVKTNFRAIVTFANRGAIQAELTTLSVGGGLILLPHNLLVPNLGENLSLSIFHHPTESFLISKAYVANMQKHASFISIGVSFNEMDSRAATILSNLIKSHSY